MLLRARPVSPPRQSPSALLRLGTACSTPCSPRRVAQQQLQLPTLLHGSSSRPVKRIVSMLQDTCASVATPQFLLPPIGGMAAIPDSPGCRIASQCSFHSSARTKSAARIIRSVGWFATAPRPDALTNSPRKMAFARDRTASWQVILSVPPSGGAPVRGHPTPSARAAELGPAAASELMPVRLTIR